LARPERHGVNLRLLRRNLRAHVSRASAIWLQTMVAPTAGDTIELQDNFRARDGYFAAEQPSFWGCRVG